MKQRSATRAILGPMIVLTSDSQAVGLLYVGNGTQTYACAMLLVMSALQGTLH